MNTAQVLLVADTWGTQGGWWIAMCVVMMVCMAAMMFGMARVRTASEYRRPAPWERFMTREILDRRFAEGTISLEEYEQQSQQFAAHDPRQTDLADPQPPPAVGPT